MDDTMMPEEAGRLHLQGPHWHRGPEQAATPEWLPLRLLMPSSGFSVEITRPDVLVGRHTDADVRLPLPDISRRHCRIFLSEGAWQILDLNSMNGVYVNGLKVQRAILQHRDVVVIGGFTFEIELGRNTKTVELTNEFKNTREVLQRIAKVLPPAVPDSAHERRRAG